MHGGIHVQPNPAPEGGSVTISVTGSGPWFVVDDRNGSIVELEINADGSVTIPVPVPGGETFTVTDLGTPTPTEAIVPVEGNR